MIDYYQLRTSVIILIINRGIFFFTPFILVLYRKLVLHGFRHGKDHNVLVRQEFPPPPLQPCRFILNPDLAKFHKAPFFGSFFATKRGHSLLCRSNVLVRISAYISQHKTMYLHAVLGPFLFTPFLRHFDIQM